MLQRFCHAARDIIGARYAVAGILEDDGRRLRSFFTSGMDAAAATHLGLTDPATAGPGGVLAELRPVRLHNPSGDPTALGFSPTYPPVHSWLGAPVVSPGRAYGWLGLLNKIGTEQFSEEDERLAGILAAQVGRIYESGSLYEEIRRRATDLEREIAERRHTEEVLRLQTRLAHLGGDVGIALTGTGTLREILQHCTAALVHHLDAAFARIWTVNEAGDLLELQASAGLYTHLDGPHSRVPVGQLKIGWIAQNRQPHLTNDVANDPRVSDKEWALREGMVAFAGYPLLIGDHLVGVMAMFARQPLSESALRAMGSVANQIAVGIQRKRAEAERDRLLDRLRMQIDRMPLAYVLLDSDFRVLDWNRTAEQIFGYAKEEVLGTGPLFEKIVPPSMRRQTKEILARLRAGDMAAHSIGENRTKDGQIIICEWSNTPLLDADGTFLGILSLGQDVTERKRLEEQYLQAQQRLRDIIASSPVVLFTLAVAGEQIQGISWISDNLVEVFGYRPEVALARDWWLGTIHPEDREQVIAQTHAELFRQGHTIHEYRFRHADGRHCWTRGELRLIRDEAGRPVEVVGSWSDITERKNLEDQYRQAQKMEAIGRLAGGVAHDFNNLLTVINGYGELVLSHLPPGNPIRELIQAVVAAGDRAAGLTRQLLAFSRKAIVEPRILDLKAVVADIDKLLRRIIGEDIQLTVIADAALGRVKADPGQIEQVIVNLVVNARDAMPQGGRLTIEVCNVELDESYARQHTDARPGPHVLLAVSDTGCGMDQATMSHIFEPFFTTKGEKGTGLGLATVHGIVKQSGGHVGVYSEVGRGTTFKVYLPRTEERPVSGKSHHGLAVLPHGRETVLLVEDEEGVRVLSRHILHGCGYTVLEACDGADALRVAGQHPGPIDLLITDVVMPRMGGSELAGQLAARHAGMRVLFLSGYTDDAVVRHGILENQVQFLQKPFTPVALAVKVREVLDNN